jgi:hypothetical protein
MSRTFIFVSKDKAKVDSKADAWHGAGLDVTGIGPTDIIEVPGEAGAKIVWDSGEPDDWYVVVGTTDPRGDWIKAEGP